MMEPAANGSGETITMQREIEPEVQEGGFAIWDRQPGWMRYIVIEPGGYTVEPKPGTAEVDHFLPEAMREIDRAVTDQNQDTQTPRPLLRR